MDMHNGREAVATRPGAPRNARGSALAVAAGPRPAAAGPGTGRYAGPDAPPEPAPQAAPGGGRADGAADGPAPPEPAAAGPADVYLRVHADPAFQEVRRRHRRFVLPATAAFLSWYGAYVAAAAFAPGLMGRRVAGALNVAMLTGLAQFATTTLLAWAYARHARLRRDRAALELRWVAQELIREPPR
ncbi:DUF485 domain-containing protein [Streptomyces sp. B1866]|uniref:DUF485 domain-containing protein n=1 Tax=Streptomyces sp. B1866 TaxID=3075431 RepID=UPI00288DE8C3|nr:DUF485 domain-containing protein [Streptomyces sp. B1866]MDT3398782.1 DUF485 domain-containing protein [Streptomyces sp. B1866]